MASAALDIGTLSGRIELEDRLTSVVDLATKKVEQFDERFGGLGKTMLAQATSFFTAEAALKAVEGAISAGISAIKTLTYEGAGVADVEENFIRLNEQAGRVGETLLGVLRAGTHSTISDFELMKSVNADMAAGMKLTADQYKVLTEGAFALAQSTGGSVADAFDKVSQAMLTGRVRGVQMLVGKIDMAAAEEDYAKKLNTTTDHLGAELKLEAVREAILKKVGDATARLGEQTDGLDERVDQAATTWKNFEEDLGKTIATSPVLMAGLDGIKDALTEAFGGSSESLVKNIALAIDNVAISAVDAAEFLVDGVAIAGVHWNAFRVVIENVKAGWEAIDYVLGNVFLSLIKIANVATGGTLDETIKDTEAYLDSLYTSMAEGQAKIEGFKKAEDEWAIQTGHVNEALEKIKARMEAARDAVHETTPEVAALAVAKAQAAKAANDLAGAEDKARLVMEKTAEEMKAARDALKEIDSAGKDYADTVSKIDTETLASVKSYIAAGVEVGKLASAYNLTGTQMKAIVELHKQETEALKLEQKAINDSISRWAEYNQLVVSLNGTQTEQTVADVERWKAAQIKSHRDAKTATADFYDWLGKTEAAMYQKSDQQRLLADSHSRDSFDKIAQDAEEAYRFALEHADRFTSEYIAELKKTADASAITAASWESNLGGALDEVEGKVRLLSGEMVSLQEKADRLARGGSQQITSQNFAESLHSIQTGGGFDKSGSSNIDSATAFSMAKQGYSFQEIIDIFNRKKTSSGPIPPPQGPRIPGFEKGGVGDFREGTLAMLHGPEAIIPLSQAGVMGGVTIQSGAIVLQFPIMRDRQSLDALGQVVGEALTQRMMGQGWRPPLIARR